MCIFCCTFAHVYILPHILHHRSTALPHPGMANMLDNSTPMPSQRALCAVRIYGVGTCAALLRHHALWLLVWAKAVACNRNHLHFLTTPPFLQRLQDCTYQRLTPIFCYRFTCFLTTHHRHYQCPTTRPHQLHRRLCWFWRRRGYSLHSYPPPTACQRWYHECPRQPRFCTLPPWPNGRG